MSNQDLAAPPTPVEQEDHPLLTRRRMVRWAVVLATGILAVLACWQDPVYAADTTDPVRVTLHTDGRGPVWVNAAHPDGSPVTDDIAATLTARERDGHTVLPVPLTDLRDDEGSVRYVGTLAAGVWTVTVDVAQPGPGTCTAVLTAAATDGAAESVACDEDAPTTTHVLATDADPGAGHTSTMALLIGAAIVALLFTAVSLATIRRRSPA